MDVLYKGGTMGTTITKAKADIENTIEQYSSTIFKIAFSYTKSKETAEDIIQNVFVKYMTSSYVFSDNEHKKAWLIRVTVNECKKYFRWLKYQFNHKTTDISAVSETEHHDLYDAVMELPSKYRMVIHLYYYEQLSVKEISEMLKKKENTIMSLLHRARKQLKKILEADYEY